MYDCVIIALSQLQKQFILVPVNSQKEYLYTISCIFKCHILKTILRYWNYIDHTELGFGQVIHDDVNYKGNTKLYC